MTYENFSLKQKTLDGLKGKTFVFFNFETTGLSPVTGKIIEIGAVRIVDGVVVDTFSTFINPECKVPREITELTSITDDMVAGAPTFPEIIADFFKYCENATIVAHNIDFDSGFLKFNTVDSGYLFNHPQMDTLVMARKYFKTQDSQNSPQNYKLTTLAEFFNIPTDNAHRAIDDCRMTAELFLKLTELSNQQ